MLTSFAWLLALLPFVLYFHWSQTPIVNQHSRLQDTTPNHGAVVSESKSCGQIGIDLLKAGGNAADAVVSPYHSGIGGGGFALIRAPNGTYEALDFRETAPASSYEDMFQGNVLGSIYGGLPR